MIRLKKFKLWNSVIALTLVAVLFGCAKPAGDTPESTSTESAPSSDQTAGTALDRELIGYWFGTARIDPQSLEAAMKSQSVESQAETSVLVRSFMTTEMAMVFQADGRMQNEVEMIIGGSPVRESATGAWKQVDQKEDELTIDMVEHLADGSITSSLKVIRFGPERNSFEISVPLGDRLQDVNARIVFERQSEPELVAER